MSTLLKKFRNDESGATAIEYGLIAAIMAVALIATFPLITGGLTSAFGTIETQLKAKPAS